MSKATDGAARNPTKEGNLKKHNNCTEVDATSNSDFVEVSVLPDVSITSAGSAYPLHLNYESTTVKTELEDANGGILNGEGLKLLRLTGELAALGTFRAIAQRAVSAGSTSA